MVAEMKKLIKTIDTIDIIHIIVRKFFRKKRRIFSKTEKKIWLDFPKNEYEETKQRSGLEFYRQNKWNDLRLYPVSEIVEKLFPEN